MVSVYLGPNYRVLGRVPGATVFTCVEKCRIFPWEPTLSVSSTDLLSDKSFIKLSYLDIYLLSTEAEANMGLSTEAYSFEQEMAELALG